MKHVVFFSDGIGSYMTAKRVIEKHGKNNVDLLFTDAKKVFCLTMKQDRCPNSGLVEYEDFCRYLTRSELEQAQNLPVGYTKSISYNQAQAVLGNGWDVGMITHLLEEMKKTYQVQERLFA